MQYLELSINDNLDKKEEFKNKFSLKSKIFFGLLCILIIILIITFIILTIKGNKDLNEKINKPNNDKAEIIQEIDEIKKNISQNRL